MRATVFTILPFLAGYFISYFIRTVNAVIAPELIRELGLTPGGLGALTSAYFLAFAIGQLPVGLLLDRFGPRRTESVLLLLAALGATGFALGRDQTSLMIWRAVMGFGVSACLMAALKFTAQRFEAKRQAALTGMVMAAGGLGAVLSSTPLEWALPYIGWRAVFFILAVSSVLVALYMFWRVDDVDEKPAVRPNATTMQGLLAVFRTRVFWIYVPVAAFATGGYMAVQGLWVVPWLMHVEDLTRAAAARHQLALCAAGLCGQLTIAAFATRWIQRGITQWHLMMVGLVIAMLVQLFVALAGGTSYWPWILLGAAGSTGAQVYSLLASCFPLALTGRVMTSINLAVFLGAFAVQWGFGAMIDLTQAHVGQIWAYRVALLMLVGLQMLALAMLYFATRREQR
jgi:MFS family permease